MRVCLWPAGYGDVVLWLLIDFVMLVVTFGALGWSALRVLRKVRVARGAAAELRGRLGELGAQTAVLSERLDTLEMTSRMATADEG